MNVAHFLFGKRPQLCIKAPPERVAWRAVRPKEDQKPVRAWRAEQDHAVHTNSGALHARGGRDYIISYGGNDHAVVRADIFEKTYEPLGGGLYRKRTDVTLRYFTIDRPALVETLEGEQEARPGDWIMQGVVGELWPVPADEALKKYEPLNPQP